MYIRRDTLNTLWLSYQLHTTFKHFREQEDVMIPSARNNYVPNAGSFRGVRVGGRTSPPPVLGLSSGGGFDYQSAFGPNPWAGATGLITSLLSQMRGGFAGPANTGTRRSGRRSFGEWGSSVARPNDRAVRDYMSHVLGGQRNQLDDYVRRAAGAGIKRSGLNVRGGPALDSSLHHMAMSNLARGYGDRFREGMNYNKYVKGTMYSQQSDRLKNLQNLMGLQHQYLSSQADWRNRLANLIHGDWRDDLQYNRQAPFRQQQLERARRQMELERRKWMQQEVDRNRSREKQSDLEGAWQRLKAKSSGLGAWTPGDLWELERTMVGLGIRSPMSKKVSMSF